jgi:TonB-linked SusC/RagA family outer membrane protein
MKYRTREEGGAMARRVRQIVVFLFTVAAFPVVAQAQNGTITGRVVDSASSAPIPSAQIRIVGTDRGAVSADNGQFTITNVKPGTYEIRSLRIGFRASTKTVTITAGGTTTVPFTLAVAVVTLDQVVTTATGGTERKRENGASIGVLRVDSLPLAAVKSAADALSSRIPGVTVEQPNGTAGSSTRIRIRGSNSISMSNDPLIMVDGVRVDNTSNSSAIFTGASGPSRLNDINPNDIADIQVIKGPAAAALYGTAAANGVIQITTKRGQQGRTRFSAYAENGSVREDTKFPANYSQIGITPDGDHVTDCNLLSQADGVCTAIADSLAIWNPLEQASPFVRGNRSSYGLSASGGNAATTYYVGGSYLQEQGIYESNKLRNIDFHSNMHSQLTDNFDVTVNAGYMDGYVTRPPDGDNLGSIVSQGLFGSAFDDPELRGYFYASPYTSQQIQTEQDVHHFTGSTTGNYLPLRWLTLTAVGGVDYVNRLDAQFIAPGAFSPAQDPNFAQGQRTLAPYQFFNYTANGSAVARYSLSRIGAAASSTLGIQYNRSRVQGSRAFGQNLAPGTESLAGASALFSVGETNSGLATVGYLAQQQLSWSDRVFATAAIRTDRTSAFGTAFKRIYYPAGSLSWVIGDEPFFPKTNYVSSLRLRTAYGTSGQNPQFRQAITYFTPTSVALGGTVTPGVSIGGTGNSELRPEKSKEFEAGFDAGLFRERVNTEFTFYNKVTDDALVAQNLPPSLGTSTTRFINIGKVRNTGIELLVNGKIVDTKPVRVELAVNATTVHNKVVNLGAGIAPIVSFNEVVQSGYPLGAYFSRTIKSYSDANGNGILEPDEITLSDKSEYIGTPFPTYTLAVTPSVTLFGNIRLSALVDRRGGQKLWDYNGGVRCAQIENCREIQDPSTPIADQVASVAAHSLGTYAGYIEDASFTKLREVSMTITAPASFAKRMGASNLSLTLAGRNLHTWTNYKGLDPETNIGTDGFTAIDLESTPQVKSYTARINVSW